jgi:carbon-monoxide dehydrogenase medium subunit
MINTRLLSQDLEYFEPGTIEEALEILDRFGADARVIAGGTDLLVRMKQEMVQAKYLVHVKRIPELNVIENGDMLRIGAATLLREVLDFCSGREKYAALFEAIKSLATPPIRNMGTVGGNLCNASPAADSAPPLLVLDARVKLRSLRGERVLPLTEFFEDVNVTVIAPDEIMTEIQIPAAPEDSGSAFQKMTRAGGAGIAKVNAAAFLEPEGDRCKSCRIALGSVGPAPMRVPQAEEFVIGKKIDSDMLEDVGKRAAEEIRPITDIRSTALYRKRVAAVLVRDVIWKAWQRTGVLNP